MRIIYNPKEPDGATIRNFAFRGKGKEKGYFYGLKAGQALKFEDEAAEALLTQYTFLDELDEENKVVRCDGFPKRVGHQVDLAGLEVKEYQPQREVPNLIKETLTPRVVDEVETKGLDYGVGLEDDEAEDWTPPRSKFAK